MITAKAMKNSPASAILIVLPAFGLLTACAGDTGRYPSLAIRDAERVQGQYTPASSDTPAAPIQPVAASTDIAALVAQAEASHQRFTQAEAGARELVAGARGLTIESNERQLALIALSDLSSLRSDTAVNLGSLDLLAAQASTTFAPTEELAAARALVLDLVTAEDAALDALWTELSQ
jgi:hypothetical protein